MSKKKRPKKAKRTVKTKHSIERKNYTVYRDYDEREQRVSRSDLQRYRNTEEERRRKERENIAFARDKLRWLIENNFDYGDYHVILHYATQPGETPRSDQQIETDVRKFLRALRYAYDCRRQELLYIRVYHRNESTGRLHLHLIVNKIDRDIILNCWRRVQERAGCRKIAEANVICLRDSYYKISGYFAKQFETILRGDIRKRYSRSMNWLAPEIHYEYVEASDGINDFIIDETFPEKRLDEDTYRIGIDRRGNIVESGIFR